MIELVRNSLIDVLLHARKLAPWLVYYVRTFEVIIWHWFINTCVCHALITMKLYIISINSIIISQLFINNAMPHALIIMIGHLDERDVYQERKLDVMQGKSCKNKTQKTKPRRNKGVSIRSLQGDRNMRPLNCNSLMTVLVISVAQLLKHYIVTNAIFH